MAGDLASTIDWLGHDSVRLRGSRTVYIDPWKLDRGAPPADVILVTHDHYDHLSLPDIEAVSTPATAVVGPAEVAAKVRGAQTIAVDQTLDVAGVRVTAVPAYNTNKFRAPGRVFHPQAEGKVGYIVELDGRRIYHAGDADAIPEMASIDVDVALLPVSGTYVMTAEEAVEACTTLKAKVVVPMHYGDIVGSVADAERFARLCSLPVQILAKARP